MRPGFSHVTHYINELGERGSSTEVIMRYSAFDFTVLLYLCFASTLWVTFRNSGITRWQPNLLPLKG
ncbi:hypothetical protein MGMO_3c00070 [Methyloglobulus morosus KoM1]|uniref:Uncharacterized protein n=2 Tax=Methyloglobulus TaxID=1410680 RepID=V5BLE4_9GAMM|nr:hypothetical protein MGMO_3c00070 [Methyloglobulus morosus KoM1]